MLNDFSIVNYCRLKSTGNFAEGVFKKFADKIEHIGKECDNVKHNNLLSLIKISAVTS
jgi:hypothetical protein